MKKKIKWIVLAVIVLGVIGAAMGGNDGSVLISTLYKQKKTGTNQIKLINIKKQLK